MQNWKLGIIGFCGFSLWYIYFTIRFVLIHFVTRVCYFLNKTQDIVIVFLLKQMPGFKGQSPLATWTKQIKEYDSLYRS